MNIKQRTQAFVKAGLFIQRHFDKNTRLGAEKGLHDGLDHLIDLAFTYNGWFIRDFVEESLRSIAAMLGEKSLEVFTVRISGPPAPKTIAIIMAGNIPMVGFHDLMCVLLSGHKALVKLSADDNLLMPFFIKLLNHYQPGLGDMITYPGAKLSGFDAVIATGSTNSAGYFNYYFGKYPHIIRRNRSSAAILTGNESREDLQKLGKDIFLYFGLGCRSVSKLFVPEGYKFDALFEEMFGYKFVIDNKKYSNNYEYNRAVYLMNLEPFLDNNFLIIKKDQGLHSPVAVLYYSEYSSQQQLQSMLDTSASDLQCIVGAGPGRVPFGYSQQPVITDFADGVDTLNFLVNL